MRSLWSCRVRQRNPLRVRATATMLRYTMRATWFAVTTGAAALGFLSVGVFGNGPIGDASIILGIFLATVSLGIVFAVGTETLANRTRRSRPGNCSVCRTSMHQIDTIWVCPACDLAPAVH